MKKYILIIGGLFIAVALILSAIHWNKEVKTTAEKAKEYLTSLAEKDSQATEKLPSANDQDTEQKQQKDTATKKDPSSNHSNQTDSNTSSSDSVAIEQDGQQNGSDSNGTPIPETDSPKTEGKSLSEIKSTYQKIFTDLEVQEASTLDQLLVQAKADFISGKYSKVELVSKYRSTAKQIERQADKSFNALYSQLQSDLSKYGHDPNEASEFKSEYNSQKQARLSHTISQLQSF